MFYFSFFNLVQGPPTSTALAQMWISNHMTHNGTQWQARSHYEILQILQCIHYSGSPRARVSTLPLLSRSAVNSHIIAPSLSLSARPLCLEKSNKRSSDRHRPWAKLSTMRCLLPRCCCNWTHPPRCSFVEMALVLRRSTRGVFFYDNFSKCRPIFILFFTVKFRKDLWMKLGLKLTPPL